MIARVIVLNWDGKAWLEACLSSVTAQRGRPCEVVLVDSASTDGSAAFVRDRFPGVQVVELGSNLGYAAGNNAGASGARTPYLVFLNNDTRVAPDWLEALVSTAESDPSIGLVTSRIVYLERPDVIDSAGDGYLRCGGGFKRRHGQPSEQAPASGEVFGACGAAFLIRRDLFEALGGFDEDFFMVYEDVDLSYRARLRGARVRYAAEARVEHAGSASLGRVSGRAVFYGQRNLEWTWMKNTPARLWWRSLPSHLAYTAAGVLGYARQGQLGAWWRGKLSALAGLPTILKKRRRIQQSATVDPEALWRLMEPDWIGVKRREKQFDFR